MKVGALTPGYDHRSKGVDDRDAGEPADELVKLSIQCSCSQLEEGDYYRKDLMGRRAVTTEGYDLGKSRRYDGNRI